MGLTREQVEMWRDDLCRRYGTAAIPLCDLAHKGLQVEAMRWVPVSERLPVMPDDPTSAARVLAWVVKEGMGWMTIRFYRRPEWNKTHPEWWSGGDAVEGETITHWMPLPAAPEQALKMNEEGK